MKYPTLPGPALVDSTEIVTITVSELRIENQVCLSLEQKNDLELRMREMRFAACASILDSALGYESKPAKEPLGMVSLLSARLTA